MLCKQCVFSQLSCASTVIRNRLASQFPVHGTRLTRRRSIGNFQCLAHLSANSSLRVPVPRVNVDAQTMAALLHLHGLPWHAMLA